MSESRASVFGRVIEGLLRPLVRALISQGVTAPALYRIVKKLYVDVAEKDFAIEGARQTDSRISVLTGVHRRDVKAFREGADGDDGAVREKVTTIASVLGKWLADPAYTDRNGNALTLPRTASRGASFEALVSSVSRDIRPRTVLDELVNQGLVRVDERERISLDTEAFFGPADTDQKIHFFAENVGDHIAAAVENLLADEPPFMERAVFYNRLSPKSVAELEEAARTHGMEALTALNTRANALQNEDLEKADGTERFRFGVFFYREDEAAGETLSTNQAKKGANDEQD
ncbi:MAG: DUF6502 family protein [Pseudomonadota bacterium]